MKAATRELLALSKMLDISIHAAREGGDLLAVYARKVKPISIHAAREGGDWRMRREDRISGGFQSTPPVKAATVVGLINGRLSSISIHAAREGGDLRVRSPNLIVGAFQSTPPVKAATMDRNAYAADFLTFQSTPPVKAATAVFL